MNKQIKEPLTYFVIYIFMILFTFGHAYHNVPDEEHAKIAGIEYTIQNGVGVKAFGAFVSSFAWPLYWSVQVWRK